MSPVVTWLYVPGDRPERFDKAMASDADVVIFDLEDAVSDRAKERARRHVVDYLSNQPEDASPARPRIHVRVNGPGTGWARADVSALVGLHALDAVRVPAVDRPEDIDDVVTVLGAGTHIHALIESAVGLRAIDDIAAHPAVVGIALGEQDLTTALGLRDGSALQVIRLTAVLAAAAAGLEPVPMSVYPHVHDLDGLRETTRLGRGVGMFGRTAIHPAQLEVIRECFTPSEDEIAWARSVASAAEQHAVGAFTLASGDFVDRPIVERARRTLELADRVGSADRGSRLTASTQNQE